MNSVAEKSVVVVARAAEHTNQLPGGYLVAGSCCWASPAGQALLDHQLV